jgi:hypothetical protein
MCLSSYRLHEYEALRAELLSHIEAIRSIESETILGMGAVAAWLLAGPPADIVHDIRLYGGAALFIFVYCNFIRVRDRQRRILRLAGYISAIEVCEGQDIHIEFQERDKAFVCDLPGFEHFRVHIDTKDPPEPHRLHCKEVTNSWLDRFNRERSKLRHTNVEVYHQLLWPMLMLMALIISLALVNLSDQGGRDVGKPIPPVETKNPE